MGENKSRSFLQLLDHARENAVILMLLENDALFIVHIHCVGARSDVIVR